MNRRIITFFGMPFSLWIPTLVGAFLLVPATLSQVALWQRKEYRYDRMRAYIVSPEGALIYQPWLLVAFLCVGLGWIAFLFEIAHLPEFLGYISLGLVATYHIGRIRRQGLLRPHWTVKATIVLVASIIFLLAYIYVTFIASVLVVMQWATLHFFLPLLIAAAVAIINIPFTVKKKHIIDSAIELRKKQSHLTVIGITGSFGKTSTKQFLFHLVSDSGKRVVMTQEHRNSYVAVAQDILQQLHRPSDMYIAEMGAYRRGEVAEIAAMVEPSIGIITAIGNQHLELFGSKQNLLKAKWELADSLPTTGTLIINADDELLVKAAKDVKQKVVRYSMKEKADVYADNVVIEPTSLFFGLHIGDKSHGVRVPLASSGSLGSLLAAIAGAYAVGISFDHILERIPSIKAVSRTMEIKTGIHGTTIIDDSYSGGEHAALNAIEHMNHFSSSDKRIVFVPIIELGPDGKRAHEQIGKALAASGAHIYIYGQAYREVVEPCFIGQGSRVQWFTNPVSFVEEVTSGLSKQTVILLEGRAPSLLSQTLYT